jgi:hypothetical protein
LLNKLGPGGPNFDISFNPYNFLSTKFQDSFNLLELTGVYGELVNMLVVAPLMDLADSPVNNRNMYKEIRSFTAIAPKIELLISILADAQGQPSSTGKSLIALGWPPVGDLIGWSNARSRYSQYVQDAIDSMFYLVNTGDAGPYQKILNEAMKNAVNVNLGTASAKSKVTGSLLTPYGHLSQQALSNLMDYVNRESGVDVPTSDVPESFETEESIVTPQPELLEPIPEYGGDH